MQSMHLSISYISENRNLEIVRDELLKARLIGVDSETTGLDPLTKKVRLLQLATVDKVFVIDCFKVSPRAIKDLILEPIFSNPDIVKVFHNAKFDCKFICTGFDYQLDDITPIYDTYIMSKMCTGGTYYTASLENLAMDYLGVELDKSNQKYNWAGTIYKEQIVYAALDAAVLIPLYHVLNRAINVNSLQKAALLETNAVIPIAQMELNGILLNRDAWLEIAEAGREELYRIEKELENYFGRINFGSNPQLVKGLVELTGLGIKSVDKDALKSLIEDYVPNPGLFDSRDYRPAVLKLMEYKKESKRYDSFGPKFLNHIHSKTGRIHPSFRQIDTNTFRLSCGEPNLQQIPRDSAMRNCFIAAPGHKLITMDYSQIELRLLAQYSKDPSLIRAFEEDLDLHTFTASEMFNIPMDKVRPDQRQFAKTIAFGVPYGMGAPKLAGILNITVEKAKSLLKKYYAGKPGLTAWFASQQEYFREYGCVRTAAGNLKDVSSWWHDDDKEWSAIQASKNTPIQGSSANIIKLAITRMKKELPTEIKLINCVHDETVTEVPEADANEYADDIERIMVDAAREYIPDVKVTVSRHIGDTWSK